LAVDVPALDDELLSALAIFAATLAGAEGSSNE
jgi:hypothetical protein